jgi:hypothetical protein
MVYSSKYWYVADNFEPTWDKRSEVATKLLSNIGEFNLFELGSGPRFPLRVALANSNTFLSYKPCDLNGWDSSVMILDLNKSDNLKLLEVEVQKIVRGASVFSLLGVLEYLEDVNKTLESLKQFGDYLLISYCCRKNTQTHNSNWQNSYSKSEFLGVLHKLDLQIVSSLDYEDYEDFQQKIFLVKT